MTQSEVDPDYLPACCSNLRASFIDGGFQLHVLADNCYVLCLLDSRVVIYGSSFQYFCNHSVQRRGDDTGTGTFSAPRPAAHAFNGKLFRRLQT